MINSSMAAPYFLRRGLPRTALAGARRDFAATTLRFACLTPAARLRLLAAAFGFFALGRAAARLTEPERFAEPARLDGAACLRIAAFLTSGAAPPRSCSSIPGFSSVDMSCVI